MAYLLWTRFKDQYEMIFVFANTSREKQETLLFVHQLQVHFGLPIVWVQAVVHHGVRKSSTHEIVTYETACRDGSVFEEVIKKYGIPSTAIPHCTRELKTNPIKSYAKSLGWTGYQTVIGYRADEPKRVNLLAAQVKKQWYPLFEWGIRKPDVAVFWKKQVFDLLLADYNGNCELCPKKSKRKLLTQIVEKPESVIWVLDMQNKHGMVAPLGYTGRLPMRFFRGWESIQDLIAESKLPFQRSVDQSMNTLGAGQGQQIEFDFELDEQESCAESCEPF